MLNKLKALRKEREDGFTLIELLVVILIIGILSAIAVPVFLNQRKTANDATVQSDVKNAATQMETWLVGNSAVATPLPSSTTLSVKKSDGVNLILVKTAAAGDPIANGYRICGWHSNGKNYTTNSKTLIYDSNNGGLQKGAPTGCGTSTIIQVGL